MGNDCVNFNDLEDREISNMIFSEKLKKLNYGIDPIFHGASSNASIIKQVMEFKSIQTGERVEIPGARPKRSRVWDDHVMVMTITCSV
jgi:hypothetical protein